MAERSFNEASKMLNSVYSKVDVEKEEKVISKNFFISQKNVYLSKICSQKCST